MANRLVLADASPLIGLAVAGEFDLLRELFNQVTVTDAVRDEVLSGGELPGSQELRDAIRAGWVVVADAPIDAVAFPGLGAGEASTLGFAIRHPDSCLVLMDDFLGRSHARANGLAYTGLAGVLVAAKKQGLVSAVRPALDRLEASNFRLSRRLAAAVLEQAGELQIDKTIQAPD